MEWILGYHARRSSYADQVKSAELSYADAISQLDRMGRIVNPSFEELQCDQPSDSSRHSTDGND
jgi:hypothetical protein